MDYKPKNRNHQIEVKLRNVLFEYFSVSELRTLCHDLNINDELIDGTKSDLVLEIVQHTRRRGNLEKLVDYVREKRPDLALTRELDILWKKFNKDIVNLEASAPKTPLNLHFNHKIILASLFIIITIGGLLLVSNSFSRPLNYTVRVRDEQTGASISRAKVSLEIVGVAPLNTFSDSDGFARIQIPETYLNTLGRLLVEKDGYYSVAREINITVNTLPEQVYLLPEPFSE